MYQTTTQVLINRNVLLIKAFLELRKQGVKSREALKQAAKNYPHETISGSLVNSLIYDATYSNAKEAWKIVKEEQEIELESVSSKNLLSAQGCNTQSLSA